mgnify:CR=1 FL=1
MKTRERVLNSDGSFSNFPTIERAKAESKGLVQPLPEEVEEPSTVPQAAKATKQKLNKEAKKNNEVMLKKQMKAENEQRISGN